jgi:hypothetical protein
MNIEIKKVDGTIILSGEYQSAKDAIEQNKYNLHGADLRDISLCGADLHYASLCDADLGSVGLCGADLRYANLQGADLGYASLCGANLRYANLQGVNLGSVSLCGADLRYANLQGADLRYASLCGVDLRYANLCDADLGGVSLCGADLGGAKGIKIPTISISGTMHSVYYSGITIKIGCYNHDVNYWMQNYVDIGKKHNYTEEQINEYCNYIKLIKQLEEVK